MKEDFFLKGIVLILISIFFIGLVSAHEEQEQFYNTANISLILIIIAGINAILFVAISSFYKKKKRFLFLSIIIPILIATIFLVITTIFTNIQSETGGPVHWHADYEIWACGEKLNLIDPDGLSNKVGTNLFHEHNDDRMHIEGVVTDTEEVNLQHFIETIGGEISSSAISLMTNEGPVSYENGQLCHGFLQVFVYKIENGKVTQEKEENFLEYFPSPQSQVPPGDCIIIEFAEEKEATEHICESYRIALEKGEIYGS